MTLDALIMFFGAFVAVLPFLGFPNSWDNVLFLCAGIVIVVLGIVVRRRLNQKTARTELSRVSETAPVEPPHAGETPTL